MRSRRLLIISSTGALVGALLFAVLFAASAATDDRLSLTVFDVGQGDSMLIRTPYYQNIVIDGGPDATAPTKIGGKLPFYDRTLDLVILTHPHADHIVGLIDLFERYTVKKVLINGLEHDTPEYRAFLDAVFRHRIPLAVARAGDIFRFGDDCSLEVRAPLIPYISRPSKREPSDDDLNDSSIIAMLMCTTRSFLFMGDAGEPIERELLAAGFDVDVDFIKIGHHGSRGASSSIFLEAVKPEIAAVSSGAHNSYGHPHREALQRLRKSGARVYRTDEHGDIEITSSGPDISVHTSR